MKGRLPFRQFPVALCVQFAKEEGDRIGTPETGGPAKDGKAAKEV
jgi:hypothetical protein